MGLWFTLLDINKTGYSECSIEGTDTEKRGLKNPRAPGKKGIRRETPRVHRCRFPLRFQRPALVLVGSSPAASRIPLINEAGGERAPADSKAKHGPVGKASAKTRGKGCIAQQVNLGEKKNNPLSPGKWHSEGRLLICKIKKKRIRTILSLGREQKSLTGEVSPFF